MNVYGSAWLRLLAVVMIAGRVLQLGQIAGNPLLWKRFGRNGRLRVLAIAHDRMSLENVAGSGADAAHLQRMWPTLASRCDRPQLARVSRFG
jgi:hypothetical protein